MNALSQIGKQLSDMLTAMTPQARIMAGLMVTVVVVSLGWILTTGGGTSYETLLGASFTETQLDQMETAFSEAGLRGYNRVGRQMKIPTGEKDQYLRALSASNAMPEQWGSKILSALDAGSVFESPLKQATRFQTAKEQDLATLLMQIQGIEFAAVDYDERKGSFLQEMERSCSVWVKAPLGQRIDSELIRSIAQQTANSFGGLPPESVSVIDMNGGNLYVASADPHSDSPYLNEQIRWEDKYRRDILRTLGNKYGNIELLVTAELDPTLEEASEQLTYDSAPVALATSETRKDTQNEKTLPAGRNGMAPNQDRAVANAGASISSSPNQVSTLKESQAEQKNTVGHTATLTRKAGLVPNKLTVKLGIPESYFREVWRHEQLLALGPDGKAEDIGMPDDVALTAIKTKTMANLETMLLAIPIGTRAGLEAKPYVDVYSFADLPAIPLPEPSMMAGIMGWLTDSWSTLALLAILAVGLGMMASWIKSQGDAHADTKFAEGFGLQIPENLYDELDIEDPNAAAEGEAGNRKVAFEVTGSEMKEDLSTLIKENPDVAVNLLKTWIGEAA